MPSRRWTADDWAALFILGLGALYYALAVGVGLVYHMQ
jgi:hypothetical protein